MISRFWKAKKPLHSVAVEPLHSPVLTQTKNGQEVRPGPHKIQGISAGFVPQVLDLSLVDEVAQVSQEEAMEMVPVCAKPRPRESKHCLDLNVL